MISDLLDNKRSSAIENGVVVENLLNGYYTVNIKGSSVTAYNQSSLIVPNGTIVLVTTTSWGKFIVSGNKRTAGNIPKIIIGG